MKNIDKKTEVPQSLKTAVIRSVDEEETYWFIRWIALKRKYDKLKEYIIELQSIDVAALKKENDTIKNTLSQLRIRHEQLKKKKHNGRTEQC